MAECGGRRPEAADHESVARADSDTMEVTGLARSIGAGTWKTMRNRCCGGGVFGIEESSAASLTRPVDVHVGHNPNCTG